MVHTLRLDNYYPTPRKLVLGTNSSFGTESIKIERGAGWNGLNLTATWHIPGREEPLRVALLDGDAMDVPPEVTKEAKDGVLVLAGMAPGVQQASCNVEYHILEQAGIYGGSASEPTPELAAQVLEAALQAKADAEAAAEDAAAAKANADKAQSDAEKAQQAAENAAADAAKAGPYAEAARAAQEAAESARNGAIAAQQAAENAAAAAAASKSAADTLAAEAARAAQAAENSKAAANNAADLAGENATAAQQAAATATAAANDAGQSASDAAASKAAAETAAKAAQDAQTAAAAAKAEAVKAQEAAQTAAKSAQDAQAAAEKAQDEAKAAQKGAEAARDAAAKSAADADSTANSIKDSMTQIAANKEAVSQLKKDTTALQKRQNVLVGSETGNPIAVDDAFPAPLCGLHIYGKSTQDGTPTPDAPVPIVNAGDSGTIVLTLGDGDSKTQTLTLPTPNGFPGIPVTSGGNYTDPTGQHWVCDEVDLERGVKVQRVKVKELNPDDKWAYRKLDSGNNNFQIRLANAAIASNGKPCFCNILPFKNALWNDNIQNLPKIYANNQEITASFPPSSEYSSLEAFKQLLTDVKSVIYYALATPIETPLTLAEIAAYKALTAYAPDTVVQASDGAGVKLEYQRDVYIAIKKLNKDKLDNPANPVVGQILRVKSIDETGKIVLETAAGDVDVQFSNGTVQFGIAKSK